MRPKWAPEGLPGASGRLGAPWVLSGGGPGWSWAPLGALRAPLGAVLGALGPLLGPPGARLGLIWASRGAPFGASWASVDGSLARLRKPRKSLTAQHFLMFFEVPGAPDSLQNRLEILPWRVWAPRKTSGGLVGLSWASLALSWGRLRGSWAVPGWLQAGRNPLGPAQTTSGRVQKLSSRQVMN